MTASPTLPGLLFGTMELNTDWQLSLNAIATGTFDAIDRASGQPMSLTGPQLSWAQGVNQDGTPKYQRLYTPRLDADRAAGRVSMLTWMSWNLNAQQDPFFNLANIIAGKHDAYLVQWGQDAAAYHHPFIVRFDHEMNGWWFKPYSEADANGNPANGNARGQFVQAWRHVVQLVRAQGASNVLWLWCPNPVAPLGSGPNTAAQLAGFYPGDDVVDLVGADIYNKAAAEGYPWLSFVQLLEGDGSNYGNTWAAINAIAPTKPWLLGEMGCHDAPGDKAAWIVDAFGQIAARYTSILGLCWYDVSDATHHYQLTQPAAAMTAWGQAASGARWLKGKALDPSSLSSMVSRFVPQDLEAQLAQASTSLAGVNAQLTALQQQLATAQQVDVSDQAAIGALQQQLGAAQQSAQTAQSHAAAAEGAMTAAQQHLQGLLGFAQAPVP